MRLSFGAYVNWSAIVRSHYTGTPFNPILDTIFLKPMSKFFRHTLKAWMCLAFFTAAIASRAGEDDLYKSGLNLYIRLAEQDSGTVPNQHPVTLDGAAMGDAMSIIQVWEKNWFKPNEAEKVFSTEQAHLLGQYITLGLSKATPGQDIIFALARTDKGFLGLRDLTYTSGRAFFVNGKLNVIIGEYRRSPDKFQERANASAGIPEIQYFFAHGKRTKPSDFKLAVVTGDGIDTHTVSGSKRRDWFEIDIKQAAAALAARIAQENQTAGAADSEAVRQEAARLAQERRELRLEMARMRRDMEQGAGQSGTTTEPAEQRLKTLEELQKKGLITEEEYARKREEILKDI